MKEELIIDYVKALTNLYGVVSKEKLIEIYNKQNEEHITEKEVDEVLTEGVTEEFHRIIDGNLYVHDYLYMYPHQLPNLLDQQEGKPYYIPEKKELLKHHVEEGYIHKTKEYRELENFLKKKILDDKEYAEALCEDLYYTSQHDDGEGSVRLMLSMVQDAIDFKDEKEVEKTLDMLMNLENNVRLRENRGYTSKEMMRLNRKERSAKPKKIGRNDPCPCGSGKKYKICCIDK